MVCVRTVTYSINIKGVPSPDFKAKRGVRQGDPISPYLFTLVMEYLTRMLKRLKDNKGFRFHPRCQRMNIVQLSFADDLLLFSRGDLKSVQIMFDSFQKFSKVSDLMQIKTVAEVSSRGDFEIHKI